MSMAAALDRAVRAVCPIDSVSIGKPDDKTTWRIDFALGATAPQKAAAQAAVASFVYDPAADASADASDLLSIVLADKTSVLRAIGEVQFRMLKGTLPVDATMTPAKYKTLLLSIMNGG